MPTVESMTELSRKTLYEHALPELEVDSGQLPREDHRPPTEARLKLFICFGQVEEAGLTPFARLLFDWFRVPILRVNVNWNGKKEIERITPVAHQHPRTRRSARSSRARSRSTPRAPGSAPRRAMSAQIHPRRADRSDREGFALRPAEPQAFRQGSRENFSIDVEPIQKGDLDRLAEFDALWIRATTSIDNFTYRFARRAQQEGMPVIDDPQSMIRCTNKVYLAERLGAAGVPTPRTLIVQSEKQAGELMQALGLPIVLKIPDGSFSRGVFKVDDERGAQGEDQGAAASIPIW